MAAVSPTFSFRASSAKDISHAIDPLDGLNGTEDPGPCNRCAKPIDEGQVILFNNKCWHPACFHCITCDNLLDINMNVYLDGEGNPICANCMHNCSICNQPITDFAMMYGKEMYHEECFRCQECHSPISGTVYANTSKGVYCVNCHNERMARSRRHHEEKKRRAKEREERKARREREKLSPNNVDRDKNLPPPPSEPSPNLTPSPNHLLAGRPNAAAEEELRAKSHSKNITAVLATEMKLNGLSSPRSATIREASVERDSQHTQRPRPESAPMSFEDRNDDGAYIPVVLDQDSLPNTPDLSGPAVFESPILGFQAQSPPLPNPTIAKLIAQEPVRSPPRQEAVPGLIERKTSVSKMAKEATQAIGRKMSLRSRRKSSRANNELDTTQEWKLEDIPRRKASVTSSTDGEPPCSALPDLPPPSSTTGPPNTAPPVLSDQNPKSDKSASPPLSPNQLKNDSISEVSTALTPTSLTFDGKTTPAETTGTSLPSMSPPVPVRHPNHHSPKPSRSEPFQPSPIPETDGDFSTNKSSLSTTGTEGTVTHHSNESVSHISMDSSRPSSSNGSTPAPPPMPSHLGISPLLPSLPSHLGLNFDDEISRVWLHHDRNPSMASVNSTPSGRRQSSSSSVNIMFSKVTNSLRHGRSNSMDQKSITHSRKSSRGHSKTPSQPQIVSASLEAAEEEKALLKQQLRKSASQIVELELKLQDDEEEKVEAAEVRLENAREAYAGVETEREMALTELKVLLKHKNRLEHGKKFAGTQSSCDSIIRDFEEALEKLKDQMRTQINEYTSVRADLVEETGRLRALRDNYLEEAQHLNKKNVELADLNNDIQRNMDRTPHLKTSSSGFNLFKGGHKARSPTTASISSVQSGLIKDEFVHPMSFEPKRSTDAAITDSPLSKMSDSTIIMEESTKAFVTRVTDQNNVDMPAQAKKFTWKMGTSALKKNAVKGLKSVWSGDTNVLVSSPVTISAPQLVTSTSQGNGLNIVVSGSADAPPSDVYKTHSFQPKTFKRGQKCGQCGGKINGTEMRCAVNTPCSSGRKTTKDVEASSVASETSTLFGNDLTRQAEIEGRPVPYIVTRCIEEVEANGMDYEGIYRKSGGASSLRAIIDAFESGGEVNFDHLGGSNDICAVTSALKQYFRNLPDPLLPFQSYERFLQATVGSDPNLKIAKFRAILDNMPKVNHECLHLLINHLARYFLTLNSVNHRVAEKSDINLMHASNLAVVFSPTIMRDATGTRQITDMTATNSCVKFLIENAHALFPQSKKSVSSSDRSDGVTGVPRIIDNRI